MKILIPYFRIPPENGHIMTQITNIVEELEKFENVEVNWLIYSPNKIKNSKKLSPTTKILDIHNYKNGLDILEKEKPDIVFAGADFNLIIYSLYKSAKFLKILTISSFSKSLSPISLPYKSSIKMFFETNVDHENNKKQFMQRGRFFLYKFIFAIKTEFSIKMNIFQIFHESLILLKYNLKNQILIMEPRFAADLHWLSSKSLIKPLLKAGFKKDSLVVTGDPTFDKIFQKINKLKSNKQNNKIKILFAPSTYYEHGLCTKSEQDNVIKDIISVLIKNNENIELTIKIHPSSANFQSYEEMIKKISPKILVYQNGDVLDLIVKTDILIIFPATTLHVYSAIAQKFTIVYNFVNREDWFVTKGIAFECKNVSQLLNFINDRKKHCINKEKINEVLSDFYFKLDGFASQRIAKEIIRVYSNRNN